MGLVTCIAQLHLFFKTNGVYNYEKNSVKNKRT